MAQQLSTKEIVTTEEIVHSNMLQIEAILRLLVKKGVITNQEFLDEMNELKREMAAKGTVEC